MSKAQKKSRERTRIFQETEAWMKGQLFEAVSDVVDERLRRKPKKAGKR